MTVDFSTTKNEQRKHTAYKNSAGKEKNQNAKEETNSHNMKCKSKTFFSVLKLVLNKNTEKDTDTRNQRNPLLKENTAQ